MKKGFTTIEVIGALLALTIVLMPMLGLTSAMVDSKIRYEHKDEEYNIASSICEMFRSEAVNEPYRQVVLFVNNLNDLGFSINNMLLSGIIIGNTDFMSFRDLNSQSKRYAVVLNSYIWENLKFLSVSVICMQNPDTTVNLRLGL